MTLPLVLNVSVPVTGISRSSEEIIIIKDN